MFTKNEVAALALKASPPVGVSGGYLLGIPVPEWVAYATLAWIALQAITLIKDKWVRPWLDQRKEQRGRQEKHSSE